MRNFWTDSPEAQRVESFNEALKQASGESDLTRAIDYMMKLANQVLSAEALLSWGEKNIKELRVKMLEATGEPVRVQ